MAPSDIIEGERIRLVPLETGHAAGIYAAVSRSLASLRRFPATMPWALEDPSVDRSRAFCEFAVEGRAKGAHFIFLIRERGSLPVAGVVGLHAIDRRVPSYELGFWIDPAFEGRGWVTEAGRLLLDFAAGGLRARRVQAIVDQENQRARAVCGRLGLNAEGVKTNAVRDPVSKTLRHLALFARTWPDGTE